MDVGQRPALEIDGHRPHDLVGPLDANLTGTPSRFEDPHPQAAGPIAGYRSRGGEPDIGRQPRTGHEGSAGGQGEGRLPGPGQSDAHPEPRPDRSAARRQQAVDDVGV